MRTFFVFAVILASQQILKPQTIFNLIQKTIVQTQVEKPVLFDDIDTEGWRL